MRRPAEVFEEFLCGPALRALRGDAADSGEASWRREIARLASRRILDVCGRQETVILAREELRRCYLPLGLTVIEMQAERAAESGQSHRRLLVGVAGCPGAGKSIFALLLAEVANTLLRLGGRQGVRAVVCPFDGFHYANAYLESHFVPGTNISLRKIKGRPETFDVEAAARAFTRLRSLSGELFLPDYSRRTHEPIEDGIRLGRDDLIAIVEGNFLFVSEGAFWRQVPPLFDVKVFMDTDNDERRAGLVRRHARGGRSREDALRHYEAVDLPNTLLVEQTINAADLIVRRSGGRIRSVACGPPRNRQAKAK